MPYENLKATVPNKNYGRSKQLENVEYFNYLVSTITDDASCTSEIKSRTTMAKAAFNKKKTLFTSKLDLKLGKKQCYRT
jgi:hypothetical protein